MYGACHTSQTANAEAAQVGFALSLLCKRTDASEELQFVMQLKLRRANCLGLHVQANDSRIAATARTLAMQLRRSTLSMQNDSRKGRARCFSAIRKALHDAAVAQA